MASTLAGPPRVSAPRVPRGGVRLLLVQARLTRIWFVLPVVVGLDVTVAVDRGLPWRGELAWCIESMAPAILLLAPFLAGVGAWQALRDNATDHSGLLRRCRRGQRHVVAEIAVGAALAGAAHLLVLVVLAGVSLSTARIGSWPVGAALVQLAAFPAFVALGYLVGHVVDHAVAPVLAAFLALALAYCDYLTRLPLGFLSDGVTGTLLGYRQSTLAVAGRLAFCAAVTVLCARAAMTHFAGGRARPVVTVIAAVTLVAATAAVGARPEVWRFTPGTLTADRCLGERPRTCTLPDYAPLLPRTARLVSRTAELLESAGARGGPTTYVGWWPTVAPAVATVSVAQPGTADQPALPLVIAADVVAPTSAAVARPADLTPAVAAQAVVLAWLVQQDPELGRGSGDPAAGTGVDDGRSAA